MVVFTEYHKSLLYERLNIGFSCSFCGTHFLNKIDYTTHVHEHYNTLLKKGTFICKVCNKQFGNQKIYQIHTQIHAHGSQEEQTLLAEAEASAASSSGSATSGDSSSNDQVDDASEQKTESNSSKRKKTKPPPAPPKKKGFTKLRMEDCLRCDECSCIYLEEIDYHKHMRNFHGVNNQSKKSPKKKNCRSCCSQCKGGDCSSLKQQPISRTCNNGLFKITMQDNIKDRWSKMVSERLSEAVVVKEDPDEPNLALETILSQVEVKIKTEPLDEYEFE